MTNGTKTRGRINSPALLVAIVLLVSISSFPVSGQSQEPPRFQKPTRFRYLLGVRNESQKAYGRPGRPAERGRASGNSLEPGRQPASRVQYQQHDNRPIGSGVRNIRTSAPVDPIDDPFGDRTRQDNSRFSGQGRANGSQQFQPPAGRPGQQSILQPGRSIGRPGLTSPRTLTAPSDHSFAAEARPANPGPIRQDSQPGNPPSSRFSPGSNPPQQPNSGFDPGQIEQPMDPQPLRTPGGNALRDPSQDQLRQQIFELDCDEINGVMIQKSIRQINLNMTPRVDPGKSVPQFCSFQGMPVTPRCWAPQSFYWTASAACSKPLYFQHIQLERYGHSRGPIIQPVLSAAHFFGNIAIYPYKAGIHPPNECMYALGYYRPGDCAPWLREPWPWSLKGAASQAVSAVGYTGIFR